MPEALIEIRIDYYGEDGRRNWNKSMALSEYVYLQMKGKEALLAHISQALDEVGPIAVAHDNARNHAAGPKGKLP